MKTRNIFCLLLLFTLAVSVIAFFSCQSSDSPVDLSSIYITEIKDGDLYKFNVKTGTSTPLCDDPLCDHSDENCKFSGVSRIIIKGDKIYYIKDSGIIEEYGERKLVQYIYEYSYSTGVYTKLYETRDDKYGGISYRFDYNEGYIYFYKKILENGKTRAKLYRINTISKEIEELFVSDDIFKAVIGGRLYYVETGKGIYSLNIAGEDKRYILENPNIYMIKPSSNSNYLYYSLYNNVGDTIKYSLYILNLKTSESVLVTENAPLSLYYGISDSDSTLYFLNVAEEPTLVFTGSDGHKYYNTSGGIIYSYNLKNKKTSVFYSDKNLDIFSIECVGNNLVVKYNKQVGNAYLVNAGILVLPMQEN